jgi:hypothetical protein
VRTDYAKRGRWLRTLTLLRMHERFESLYPEGYDESVTSEVVADLIGEFGPMNECRYERPPFEVAEPAEFAEYYYVGLPNEFMSEHLASLARLQSVSK